MTSGFDEGGDDGVEEAESAPLELMEEAAMVWRRRRWCGVSDGGVDGGGEDG